MTTTALLTDAPELTAEDYCVFGVATCFIREDSEFIQVQIFEPIPSGALEAIIKGIPTSYQLACAKSLGEVFNGQTPHIPAEFAQDVQLCNDFTERAIAASRTYKRKKEAQEHIPLGSIHKDFNYSLERKRVLNMVNVVNTEDNVKQHSHTHKVL